MAMAIHFIFTILDLAIRLKKWPFVFLAIRLPGVIIWPSVKFLVIGCCVVLVEAKVAAKVVFGAVVNLKWSRSVGTRPFLLMLFAVVEGLLVVVGNCVVVGGGRTAHLEHREQKYRRM